MLQGEPLPASSLYHLPGPFAFGDGKNPAVPFAEGTSGLAHPLPGSPTAWDNI